MIKYYSGLFLAVTLLLLSCCFFKKNSLTNPSSTGSGQYAFDKKIMKPVLENYLSKAITMQNLLTGQGDFDDNLRMLKHIEAKYIGRSVCQWGDETDLMKNFEIEKDLAQKVHTMDPGIILEACIFEIVSTRINQVSVPGWDLKDWTYGLKKGISVMIALSTLTGRCRITGGKVRPFQTSVETKPSCYFIF
jgi:hypothetical protein